MVRLVARVSLLSLCLIAIGASGASAAAPEIVNTKVSKVTIDSAVLQAEINPQGQETHYHFEYGPEDCSLTTCTSVPAEEGKIEGLSSPQLVATPLEGLTPGTTYHLRVVAGNPDGTIPGPDRTFSTYAPALDGLPDGRAYEQASPVNKNAADARGMVAWAKASDNGDRVAFLSTSGIPGGDGEQEVPVYLASRDASGWSTQGLLPPASLGDEAYVRGWLPDFSTVFDYAASFGASANGTFVARSSDDGALSEIVPHGEGLRQLSTRYVGAGGSLVVFEADVALACCDGAVAGKPNVYVWDRSSGQVSLASQLNDEKAPPAGAFAGPYDWMLKSTLPLVAKSGGSAGNYYTQDLHAISADGNSVFFTAAGSGKLYERINPTAKQSELNGEGKCTEPERACTLNLSASHRTQPDPLGSRPAAFMAATPDGSSAFFASPEELTDAANTGPDQSPPSIGSADVSVEPRVIEAGIPSIAAGGIATDAEYLYWVNTAANTIGRVKLNGEDLEPSFIEVPPLKVGPVGSEKEVEARPQYVAVDGEHIYWTNEGEGENKEGTIGRADVKGTPQSIEASIEVKWITEASRPNGIAVDDEYVYWANAGKDEPVRTIGRAKLNGENADQVFIKEQGTEFPEGVTVDGSHIYWTVNDQVNGFVLRADLSDVSKQKFAFVGQNVDLRGIAVDGGHVYWASQGEKAIGRANLALEEVQKKFIEVGGRPKGAAMEGPKLWWSLNGESVPNPGNDLYHYRAADESLLDITPDLSDVNGAEVKGVLGISEDGKRVYLAGNGDLDGGGPAQTGNCKGEFGAGLSFSGQCSLYLLEESSPGNWSTSFITRLNAQGQSEESDALNWVGRGGAAGRYEKSALLSTDGGTLLFRSQQKLSDYNNEGRPELYRFEVGGEGPACISCNPSGEAPVRAARLGSIGLSSVVVPADAAFVLSRNLSADGKRAFFETSDGLVVNDTNGKAGCKTEGFSEFVFPSCQDVYEWEAEGAGSCEEDVQGGGCLYLLSTGASANASFFADASLNGDDAFIATRSAGLVGQDQDQLQDIFDVRVGGGLASQSPAPAPECEGLDGCHGPQSPPPGFQSPASASLGGPGNKKEARHPAKKRHKHKSKKHHRKGKRAADKTGGKNR